MKLIKLTTGTDTGPIWVNRDLILTVRDYPDAGRFQSADPGWKTIVEMVNGEEIFSTEWCSEILRDIQNSY